MFSWQLSRYNVSEQGSPSREPSLLLTQRTKSCSLTYKACPDEYDQLRQKVLLPVLKRFSVR